MVDYVSFLNRAVAALNPNTRELRQALYDRARKTLIEKLRASNPTLSNADLSAESAALEASIRRVEADAVRRAAPPPRPNLAYETDDTPLDEYQDRPPLTDTRKRWRVVAGGFGALVILLAGAASYAYWPRVLASAQSLLHERTVKAPAIQPADDTSYIRMRQLVYYRTNYPVGTIIVDKSQTFLYVVRPMLAALRYSIGVGPECTTLVGFYHVVRKEESPIWNAPSQKSTDAAYDPMKNPFGARALDLNEDYRIHGTNASPTFVQPLLKRCIGLVNDDVIDLYDRTPLGSRVVVLPE
jgi:L,D-transpeptidase catalytic domain